MGLLAFKVRTWICRKAGCVSHGKEAVPRRTRSFGEHKSFNNAHSRLWQRLVAFLFLFRDQILGLPELETI
jgi:hypothetical protein